jgi:hypothetical protein
MRDETWRIVKIGSALSQLINVALFPHHVETTPNESVSGRAYRQSLAIEQWIDAVFFWQSNPKHCERAYLSDLERAKAFQIQHDSKKL